MIKGCFSSTNISVSFFHEFSHYDNKQKCLVVFIQFFLGKNGPKLPYFERIMSKFVILRL